MGNSNTLAVTGSRHKNMVTIREAAEMIPYSENTLRNWRSDGKNMKLFVKAAGGKVLFDFDEWDKMIDIDKEETAKKEKRLKRDV
jgi:hypothetical protein